MEKPNLCLEVLKTLVQFLFKISHPYSHNSFTALASISFFVFDNKILGFSNNNNKNPNTIK